MMRFYLCVRACLVLSLLSDVAVSKKGLQIDRHIMTIRKNYDSTEGVEPAENTPKSTPDIPI